MLFCFLFLFSCTDKASQTETSESEGEITQESMDYFAAQEADEEVEEHEILLSNGYLSTPAEMKKALKNTGAAELAGSSHEVFFPRVLKEEKDFIRNCGFDAGGTYRFHIGKISEDDILVGGTNFPVLEHNFDDSNFFLIEEMEVRETGKSIILTSRRLNYNGDDYEIDMAIATEKMKLSFDKEGRLLLSDRIYEEDEQRYFMLNAFYEALPERNCDESYE